MQIRESVDSDKSQIRELHLEAFGEAEGEGETVAHLALDLLADETAQPMLSLVAEQDERIVGHIIFSVANIEGAEGVASYILAPLAVASAAQKTGIGTQLIDEGLARLKAHGAEIVLVYGDPNYYQRSGFSAGHQLAPPHPLHYPVEAWMALELAEGVLARTQGTVHCAAALDAPEYW